jgi:hypothetical protein
MVLCIGIIQISKKYKPCGDNGSLVWGGSEPRAARPYDNKWGRKWFILCIRLLVHSKWCKTEQKKKVNPADTQPGIEPFESFSEKWWCISIVLQWIHKVTVYVIWQYLEVLKLGLIVGGRVDKGIYNLLHTWPVSQPNIHGTSCTYTNLGRDRLPPTAVRMNH